MSNAKSLAGWLAILVLALTAPATTATQTLITSNASWKYNDSGTAQAGWTQVAFSDAAWPSGLAQLGYGDGDEATTISYGTNANSKRITAYFRRTFSVANPAAISALTLRYIRDDGAVIYLNGTEVVRSNMPTGTVTASTLASSAIGGADESTWQQSPAPVSLLVAGTNVIAVEIHQNAANSSDLSFALELLATDLAVPPPTVTLASPQADSVVNSTTINFQASATAQAGLASATLLLGGAPTTVSFSGTAQVQDAQLTADTPTTANGSATAINIDGQTPHAHAVMKFPTLIGAGGGQVPTGANIVTATLRLNCTNAGQTLRLYRLTQDWTENQATWNQRATGQNWGAAGADGAASNAGVAVNADCTSTGLRTIDVTRFVQEWASGSPNYGVVFTDSGTDGVDFTSSEGAAASSPLLTVTYRGGYTTLGTQIMSGTNAAVSIPATLPLGTYLWNMRVTDVDGQSSLAPADFQVTIDTAAPNAPVLVVPTDGASSVPTAIELQATVGDPSGAPVTVTAGLRKATEPEFTIIAVPDTQNYSEFYPAIFTQQTQWIVANKAARNIVFVTHEGDVVNNQGSTVEWQRANTSMSILDGVVPYGIGPGNHDVPTTNFNVYFPWTRWEGLVPWYGGHYQNTNDNNYQLFSAGGMDFVIVHLVYCPSAAAVAWADSIYKTYPDRIGIMTTHAYLNEQAQRTTHGCGSTQYLWDNLALPNPNLHFMLSGHVHDESRRSDIANGHPVYQMLADYQARANGGDGWLRILRFVPADGKVYVQTYSPYLNAYETDANSEFTLDFPMGGAFSSLGSVSVPTGGTAGFTPAALEPLTTYEWQVTATNASGKSTVGPIWRFTTGASAPVNQPPTANADSYSVQSGQTLTIAAPGVLGNDSDPNGNPLTAQLATNVTSGTLTLSANGGFTYTPTGGYTGPDAFTYRASDGQATSSAVTVSITVTPPPNQPPTATGESYSVQSGQTLTIAAPGVLSNDSDPNGNPLTAQLATNVTNGTLALSASGGFTYTPTGGYTGPDAFTYRASDGQATSSAVTVSITVTASTPTTIFSANFDATPDSFTYVDDAFKATAQPAWASGTHVTTGGFSGGALRVALGGLQNNTVLNMSGGWRRTFTLSAPATVTLSFRYLLSQGSEYENDELSEALVSVNGVLYPAPPGYLARLAGDGTGGSPVTTGWRQAQIIVPLGAGTHTVTFGAFNNKKTARDEQTTILVDDVVLTR